MSPAQEVTRIVRDELKALLGGDLVDVALHGKPAVIALVGLQGSGKTTSAAKLARLLKTRGRYPLIVAADLARPAAVQQLVTLGRQIGVPVFEPKPGQDPVSVARDGVREAKQTGRDTVIVDTAGRLHIDEALMAEIRAVAAAVEPQEILFVADAMTGQDAVKSAAGFAQALALTGIILTKTDGDARGGAALSVVTTTGKPIKFVGVGEKPEDFEPFHPDRMASRILGLGDVLTLIEKVEATVDADAARKLAEKTVAGEFTLEDLKEQLASMKKMGPLESLIDLLPEGGSVQGAPRPPERRREGSDPDDGDHRLDDRGGAPVPTDPERQPQEAGRLRLRHVGGRDQPPDQAVPGDAADDEEREEGHAGPGHVENGASGAQIRGRLTSCRMPRFC